MLASLYKKGSITFRKEQLNNRHNGLTRSLDNSLSILLLSPFGPEAYQVTRELSTFSSSNGKRVIVSNEEVISYEGTSNGIALPSSR